MNRRDLLKSVTALCATGALPAGAPAAPATGVEATGAFASSFEAVREHYPPLRVRFDRPLPDGLSGTLFRNGPAGMSHGDMRYHRWFAGDGLVQAWRLQDGMLEHSARMVATDRRRAELEAGRLLWPGFGTDVPDTRPVRSADTINTANISVLPVGDELLALWEAGSAWAVDPRTLHTRGRKVFSPQTDGLSFSAHPRVERDGRIWNFGYLSGSGRLMLYELGRDGRLVRAGALEAPNADMVHDFVITERYLGFVLMPLRFEHGLPPGHAFMNRLTWQHDEPVVVLLVDKQSWRVVHRFELPPFFAFHFGNAWEDGDSVRITVAQAPAFDDLMRAIGHATLGRPAGHLGAQPLVELVLDTARGSARVEPLPVRGAEFPAHDPRRAGLPSRMTWLLGTSDDRADDLFGFDSVIGVDRDDGRVRRFSYGNGILAEEHVFVPGAGDAEQDGWLVGTAYDWRRRRTRLSVFDAGRVDEGPVTSAELPYGLPLGLHGRWQGRT